MSSWIAVALVVLASAVAAMAGPPAEIPGSPAARAALKRCQDTADAPAAEQRARYERALADAEAAVAADDHDAAAHFAVFCALGGRMKLDGIGVSALSNLRRLRAEVDRTLELVPDFPDALAGKGALLLDTPRLLGGDVAEAERLLRRAVDVDPDYVSARLDLARCLLERGARDDAAREAQRALETAERRGDADDVAAARALLERAGAAGR